MSFAIGLTLWSTLLFGQTDVAPAPLPQSEPVRTPAMHLPDELTPEQRAHVEQAAQHLRDGGLPTLANQLEAALHEARQFAVRQELERKQAQLQVLQQEIAALERQLLPGDAIALRFTLLDVNRDLLRETDADLAQQLAMRLAARDGLIVQPDPATKPLAVHELLRRLQQATKTGAVKVLSEPTIITREGQSARMTSGGSYPLPMPNGDNAGAVGYEQFGTSVTVVPQRVDANRVHCTAQFKQSALDWGLVKTISGTKVPGLTVGYAATSFTAEFGETVLFPCPSTNSLVTLLFATVERRDSIGSHAIPVDKPE